MYGFDQTSIFQNIYTDNLGKNIREYSFNKIHYIIQRGLHVLEFTLKIVFVVELSRPVFSAPICSNEVTNILKSVNFK